MRCPIRRQGNHLTVRRDPRWRRAAVFGQRLRFADDPLGHPQPMEPLRHRLPDARVDRVLVLECVQRMGVRAVSLSDFVARTSSGVRPYPGRIVQARHQDLLSGAGQSRMADMAKFAFTGRATNSPNGKP